MSNIKLGFLSILLFVGLPNFANAFATQVPEPSMIPLLVIAGVAALIFKRKK